MKSYVAFENNVINIIKNNNYLVSNLRSKLETKKSEFNFYAEGVTTKILIYTNLRHFCLTLYIGKGETIVFILPVTFDSIDIIELTINW